ncbi:MAG: hypothetical protein JF610_11810, partial [Acidobacteria bacterium]|nr:hypothetical protein [Acidobacteriota bacterium]
MARPQAARKQGPQFGYKYFPGIRGVRSMSVDDELMLSLAAAIADGENIDWADVEARITEP